LRKARSTCSITEYSPGYVPLIPSFAYVCRDAGTPACPNSRQASASRIWEGSLYIDLRLSSDMPATSPSASPASRSTFQDRFGASSVRLPLFTSENRACVLVPREKVRPPRRSACGRSLYATCRAS
jgi:hypothetical protein